MLAVHLFGRPVAWEELQTAVPQEVVLVEDAAGALGARYRGTPCGALGVLGCLSFHPRKIVTTGEGRCGHDRRGGARGRGPPAAPPRDQHGGRCGRHRRARRQLPAPGRALRARDPAARAPRAAARRAGARRRLVRGTARAPRRDAAGRRGGQARMAGVRRVARAPRRGPRSRFGPRGSRRRSGPTPSTDSRPTRGGGRSPAPTRRSPARSLCRSRRRCARTRSTGSPRRSRRSSAESRSTFDVRTLTNGVYE